MVFNATLAIFQLNRGDKIYWWRKPDYPKKNHRQTLSQNEDIDQIPK